MLSSFYLLPVSWLRNHYNQFLLSEPHGDLYPGNIIVQEDGQILHIDFDVASAGENAKELEVSRFLWAVSDQTTDINTVAEIVEGFSNKHQYDWEHVKRFMERYEMYLRRFTNGEPRLGDKLETITLALT